MTEAKSRYLFPDDDFDAVVGALADDTNCLVLVIGVDGIVYWVNDAVVALSAKPRDALINTPIAELFPKAYVDERMALIRETASTRSPIACEGITRGLFRRTTYRPLKPVEGLPDRVLVVCRPHPQDTTTTTPSTDLPIRRATHDDLGPLAVLTERELELLDLIGRGLSTAQIATHLGRSAKTVEWHRVSLGEKLNANNRVELARIALNAGLSGGPIPHAPTSAPPSAPAPSPHPKTSGPASIAHSHASRAVEPKPSKVSESPQPPAAP